MIKPEQWVQIEIEARDCPVLQRYVGFAQHGHVTREDALVAAAVELSRTVREHLAERKRMLDVLGESARAVSPILRTTP